MERKGRRVFSTQDTRVVLLMTIAPLLFAFLSSPWTYIAAIDIVFIDGRLNVRKEFI